MQNFGTIAPGQQRTYTEQYTFGASDHLNSPIDCDITVKGDCSGIALEATDVLSMPVLPPDAPEGLLVTCDPTRLNTACEFEQLYFDNVDAIHARIQATWTNNSGSQGSPIANEMYFWMTVYQNMARMLMLAKAKGLTAHVDKYRTILMDVLRDFMPQALDGADAPNTGLGSKYRNNGGRSVPETRYAYLSLSRFLSWTGYVSWVLTKCGQLNASDQAFLQAQYPRMKISADWLNSELSGLCNWNHGGFGHMPSHLVAGMIWLEQLAGYNYPQATNCLNTFVAEWSSRNQFGSDLSHDRDTASNMMTLRDYQVCTPGVSVTLTDSIIQGLANNVASRVNSGASCVGSLCQSLPDYIAEHAVMVARSSSLEALVDPATLANYPNIASVSGTSTIDSINQAQTVVSAAWGYGHILDSDNC